MLSGTLQLMICLQWHSETKHCPGGVAPFGLGPTAEQKTHTALSTLAPPFGFLSASSVELFPGLSVEGPLATIEIRAAP